MARQAGHYIKDERLQVEDTVLKTVFFYFKKYRCGKPSKTLHEGREVTSSRQYLAVKKITIARYEEHCMRDERLQVQDNILLLKATTLARQAKHCISDERLQVEDGIFLG